MIDEIFWNLSEDRKITYEEWLNEWLGFYVKPTVKVRTYEKYKQHIKLYLAPGLGECTLDELLPLRLQKFVVSLSDKGLAPNTVNGILTVLKSSLRCAVRVGKVQREHGKSVVCPRVREKQIECFSKVEQKKMEEYILKSGSVKLFGIVLTLYTGLRIGELLALRWKDIDIRKGIVSVGKTCYDGWQGGKYVKIIDVPKTENSARIIPLPKQLLLYIREASKNSKDAYVIPGRTDCGAEIRSYQRTFTALQKKLSIEHKGFHVLRHTFATRALEVGMDVKTLSEILGHNNPAITLKRYAHSLMEHKTEMMNKLGKLLM